MLADIINGIINHNKFHFANLIFDVGICLLANHLIAVFDNSIVTLVILIITYSIVLLVNFTFKFSIKRKSIKEKTESNQSNVVEKANINKRSSIDVPIE